MTMKPNVFAGVCRMVLVIGALLPALPALAQQSSAETLFCNVRVLDVVNGRLGAPTNVLVRGNTIAVIGSSANAAAGAKNCATRNASVPTPASCCRRNWISATWHSPATTRSGTFGHASGDKALIGFAPAVTEQLRPGDLLGGTGGEEFAVVLSGVSLEQAQSIAERIRKSVESSGGPGTEIPPMTVSIGVTVSESHPSADLPALMAAADEALYRSKDLGRNRVTTN